MVAPTPCKEVDRLTYTYLPSGKNIPQRSVLGVRARASRAILLCRDHSSRWPRPTRVLRLSPFVRSLSFDGHQ
jgi:hypothetical protein